MNKPFYMVWCPEGTYPPRTRHETPEAAQQAAGRLARENPGKAFFVVEAIGYAVVPQPVSWFDLKGTLEAAEEAPQITAAN